MKKQQIQILEYFQQKIEKDAIVSKGKTLTEMTKIEMNELTEKINKIEENIKYINDEQSHLIRTLASLTKISEKCMKIAFEEKLVHSLLFLFPDPKDEIGEITPRSVILIPKYPAAAILLGNAARCLMVFADDVGRNDKLLFDVKSVSDLYATLPCTYAPTSSTTSASSALHTSSLSTFSTSVGKLKNQVDRLTMTFKYIMMCDI